VSHAPSTNRARAATGAALRTSLPEGTVPVALGLLVAVAVVAAPFAARRAGGISAWSLGVLGLGAIAGISLWWVSGYDGDAFFHLARVQKLLAFDSLSLRSLDEFRDGGLHPGYAFPLWHAAVAMIARLAGVGPASVVLHAPTVLLPLSFLLTYEAGLVLFRSRFAGLATAIAQFALLGLAPGHGGAYTSLALPATASRALLLPALLALVFAYVREPSWPLLASVAAASAGDTTYWKIGSPDGVSDCRRTAARSPCSPWRSKSRLRGNPVLSVPPLSVPR